MECEVQIASFLCFALQWRSVSDGNCVTITFFFNVNVFHLMRVSFIVGVLIVQSLPASAERPPPETVLDCQRRSALFNSCRSR